MMEGFAASVVRNWTTERPSALPFYNTQLQQAFTLAEKCISTIAALQ